MKKELLTVDNMRNDLISVFEYKSDTSSEKRLVYIVPFLLAAILVGILMKNPWPAIAVLTVPVYHTVRLVLEKREEKAQKIKMIDMLKNGELAVSLETLSHIAEEEIYEPHFGGRRARTTRTVTVFYFESGASWRRPEGYHYGWSKTYGMSSAGLENTSVAGNTFYYVTAKQGYGTAYIYNTKFFELKGFNVS